MIEGYFVKGDARGACTVNYTNGDIFNCLYNFGQPNGNGKMTFENGDTLGCNFISSKPKGKVKKTLLIKGVY